MSEITNIFLEDAATDGCWPNPKVTRNLVIARLNAAGLGYGVTPEPEIPNFPNWDDLDYDIQSKAANDAWDASRAWDAKQLNIYVHAYDFGLEVAGSPVPAPEVTNRQAGGKPAPGA